MTDLLSQRTSLRTSMVGGLTSDDAGTSPTLAGWIHRRRDLGGLLFFDLRDRTGLLQVSLGPDWTEEESLELARTLGSEDVIRVEGELALRPEEARNPELATGAVELRARTVELLNEADTPAIPVHRSPEDEPPAEELRLRHRILDLRRPELQEKLLLRHRLVLAARNHLDRLGFVEVETPILTRPTPEGARDYVVPSRVHPGEFFALPQSPQLYKQILMAAGFDRYFQIARCFRDEDLRADRQPEFTQIDVEASFIDPGDLMGWMEGLMEEMAEVAGIEARGPFRRMTHRDAMERYGTDRPDLRWSLEIRDWTEPLRRTDFRIFRSAAAEGGRIRGIPVEGGEALSRKDLDELEGVAKDAGAPGLLWVKRTGDGGSGPLSRFLGEEHYEALSLAPGDLALVAAGPDTMTSPALAAVRVAASRSLGRSSGTEHAWLWVTEFPVFEMEGDGERLVPGHHPFVQPHPDDLSLLGSEPTRVRGLAYDLVYNGSELGSGSVRIHDPDLQRRILRLLGLSEEEVEKKFGFLLEALSSGAPPHGGIALGMDRIVKDFTGARSLREVIAFPKTTAARALYEGAPAPISQAELRDLRLRLDPDPSG